MRRIWNEKRDALLRRHYAKGNLDMLAQRLGVTKEAVKSRALRLGLHRKVFVRHLWSEKQLAFLRKNYANMPITELEAQLHCKREAIRRKANYIGLNRSAEYLAEMGRMASLRPNAVASRFKKGSTSYNKGMRQEEFMTPDGIERSKATRFKPGCVSCNTKPVGYERIDASSGYVYIKVEEGRKMVLKHRYVWQSHNGDIPKGMLVTFCDGNPQNCDITNLRLCTREDHARHNIDRETAEQRRRRIEKTTAKRNEIIRKDKMRIRWGLEPKSKIVKRWYEAERNRV